MNRKGFFVSLTALIILIILVGLVVYDQSIARERSDITWEESRKELVSELVFDLEKSMIPTVIGKSVKNTLIELSPNPITLEQVQDRLSDDLSTLNDNIQQFFTIPINIDFDSIVISFAQVDPWIIDVTVELSYNLTSEHDYWYNIVEYDIPIGVHGIIHPNATYSPAGQIVMDFWKEWEGGDCVGQIVGLTCNNAINICPLLDLNCYYEGDIPGDDDEEEEDEDENDEE